MVRPFDIASVYGVGGTYTTTATACVRDTSRIRKEPGLSMTLTRRLLAGVASLVLAAGGAIALASPAQATIIKHPDVTFEDDCEGTHVTVKSGSLYNRKFTVEAGGVKYMDNETVTKKKQKTVFVPADAGEIKVDYQSSDKSWPRHHTWQEPEGCEEPEVPEPEEPVIPEPKVTYPTCDEDGSIAIPEAEGILYRLNGEDAEQGKTYPLGPGTHVVEAFVQQISPLTVGPGDDEGPVRWEFVFEAPEDCGELPKTGTPTALLIGGALMLLVIGGGLFLLARRRQVRFTS